MNIRAPEEKIFAREQLAASWQAAPPGRVVLANGLFDLVHVGHARYFADARCRGDLLVVALNDDASAAAVKGPKRPLLPLERRLIVVAAFRHVDAVTWFPERSVADTLQLLRPHLHAKGTDYRPRTLPHEEQAVHAELGIEVVIAGDPKDHATSSIIDVILGRPVRGEPD
ncbi:MAG: adenylyltransferase/cytidyltransferase family protein [Acidobacteriota bacterium]|nr:MAG: adenylyltransferase/cytidyltransferase family protein [Acidobacteriota bacterium]